MPVQSVPLDTLAAQFSRTIAESTPLTTIKAQFTRTVVHPSALDSVITVTYNMTPGNDAVKYRILVFDVQGNLTAFPQDVITFSFEDLVNGGSGTGQMDVPRAFVDLGWVGPGYRVQFYLDDGLGDPWYDGRVMEIDQADQGSSDSEVVTVHCEGWHTHLDDAIIDQLTINPGIQPNGVNNGTMNADTFLTWALARYMDSAAFGSAYVASMPVGIDQTSFNGTGLGAALDTIIKQVLDNTGQVYEWWVRGTSNGKPAIVIQPQSNPNVVTTNWYSPSKLLITQCITEFMHATIYNYRIQTTATNLFNMIALYGGTDPSTGMTAYGPYKDSTSISLYGLRQKQVTNTNLVSTASLTNYATVYLLLNAYPQPQGSFKKFRASDYARAGQWFQIYEPGLQFTDGEKFIVGTGGVLGQHPPNLKQVRAVRVVTSMQNQDRVEQEVFTTAPRAFIDNSYYGAINESANTKASQARIVGAVRLDLYHLVGGGDYVGIT